MQRVKKFLETSKMTQGEFATAVGVSQPTVSDWLSGETRPTIDKLPTLSRVTGVSIEDLVADLSTVAA